MLSFTQIQAPITELPFDEGAAVARDTVLARVDDSLYRRQTEIDRANLEFATAQVAVSESTLAAAQSNQTSDEFDLTEKQRDFARAEELVKTNAISIQGRDLAYTAARQSAAALAHEQAMVAVATTNVALAKANEAAVAAKLALDEVTLGYTTLRAPFAGVISVREAELAQLAGPGVAIFTLDDLDHVWLRAYVNEPDIGKIRLGQSADVTTDTYAGKVYHGRVSFVSPQAEFTPKTVETHAERVTLVYRSGSTSTTRRMSCCPACPPMPVSRRCHLANDRNRPPTGPRYRPDNGRDIGRDIRARPHAWVWFAGRGERGRFRGGAWGDFWPGRAGRRGQEHDHADAGRRARAGRRRDHS